MKPLSQSYSLKDFQQEVDELLLAYERGDRAAFQPVRNFAQIEGRRDLGMPVEKLDIETARYIVARSYGFENAEIFKQFIEDPQAQQFEKAIDAIVSGDISTLQDLLQQNPSLVHLKSKRIHQATLLLYTGANGVEGYRQQSPANAVAIAETLLKAGAEGDALFAQGKGTTLGQVATSEHTARAGVQIELLALLTKHGANIDGHPEGWQPLTAALDNARPEAAIWLADHGATLNIASAAGIGRLDLVKKFLQDQTSTQAQLIKALMYAAIYGHTNIVSFLIENGVDIGAQADDQYTALHWAAHGGHMETVDWLLQHGAPLETKNCYGGTPLGQTIWSAANQAGGWGGNKPRFDYFPIIKKLVAAGSNVHPFWFTNIDRIDNFLSGHLKKPLLQVKKIMPEMPLDNVTAGLAFYRDVLGFSVNYAQENIAVIDRDKVRILLVQRSAKHKGISSCYLYVEDVDALYTEFRAKGVHIENPPVSQPWGLRDFVVYDPEGNCLTFGQPFE